ncbi:MAG: ComF family protein [Planctomycetaceae bacterium]|nr:ComF family protein [Planctomycetaceae bacterium]
MGLIGQIAREARDIAFACLTPTRCRLCRAALFAHGNAFLCSDCAGKVPWIGPGACPTCGYPAGPHAVHLKECRRCHGGWMGLRGAVSVAMYRHGAKVLVTALKFGGEEELIRPMAGLMAERYRAAPFHGKLDLIAPVSLHPKRRRERGFDQAAVLAERVARTCGLEWSSACLERVRWTVPQASLGRGQRLTNLEGAFRADPAVAGRRVLLVDDVMTTGATMAECARVLKAAGARAVYGLTFAR